jgi:peptidoglycan/xylan/chitin deacetylase (PgdA/CDA1 family)/pimeloyl-ACP methyl ester carboxylesterase
MRHLSTVVALACAVFVVAITGQEPQTEITKWQDDKLAAVSITFDDSTINQFRIAVPLLNERGLPATFFVITGEIPGSKNPPTFVGRPVMEIIRESATIPTNRQNALERSSMLRYLGEVQRVEIVLKNFKPNSAGNLIEKGEFAHFDAVLAALRQTGETYAVGSKPYMPVRSQEDGRPAAQQGGLTWDELRKVAAQGHEIGNHLVSHAHTPGLDEANIRYEAEKAEEDLRAQLGPKHTFSIESAYGIHDARVEKILVPRFPLTRNWVSDEFMDGIFRGDPRDPAQMKKPYVQWQRGPLSKTTIEEMTGWIDKSLATGTWLVLVVHGVEGIGWEAVPAARLRSYFDYIKAREDRLWVATFQDAAKYARERMKSTVTTRRAGDAIEVSVTHSLDPKLYDLPLTARTTVPPGWTSVQFTQGTTTQRLAVARGGQNSSVMYRVAPNGGPVRLTQVPLALQQPPPGPGRGQGPPAYTLTDQDRASLRGKLDQLDPLIKGLKAKRGEDDLVADVDIHAKGARWMLEFPQDVAVQDDVTFALKMVDRGIERAKQLQDGQSPWAPRKGKVALGFYSALDGSVQPLLLTIPTAYDPSRPARLDVWLHGRSQRLIEGNWICYDPSSANAQTGERLWTHPQGSCLAPNPMPSATGVLNVGQFQLEVFARGNNANHWAGEVDVFEAIAAVQRRFKIDPSRIVLRGFSLGGAGAWHLALHHPDRWVAAEIGAGTWPRRYLMMNEFPPYQRPTLRIWENMTEWALNAFNLPIAGHDGDNDPQVASIPRPPEGEITRGQLESSIRIRDQLAKEGFASEGEPNELSAKGTPSIFLISENTGHSTSPKVRQRLDQFLKEWTDKGLRSPDHIRFLTYTTRYNRSFWVTVEGLARHYERAEVDARRSADGKSYEIKTANVTRLALRETGSASAIRIDGETLRVKPNSDLALEKTSSGWRVDSSAERSGLRKTHRLQGPIDDAFLDPFLLVRPTGTPWNPSAHEHALKRLERFDQSYARFYRAHPRIKNDTDVTEADFGRYNVVLFGDPGSNRWIGRLAARLPMRWTRDSIAVSKQNFSASNHLPVLVYPNPLAPARYVVLNSGLTIAENSYTSDYSMPTLGDIAVLQIQPDSEVATVPYAGFFDESWRLP